MNLEKQFGKELAKDLRHETADKLWQARKEPANFSDLSKLDKETREKKEIDFKQEEHNELDTMDGMTIEFLQDLKNNNVLLWLSK